MIETTEEEVDGYLIIKSILREIIDVSRVYLRDTQSYCGILLDDNNRKPICRFYFTENRLRIGLFDSAKKETRYDLSSLDDIYKYSQKIKDVIEYY